jgi:hypothetical protein
VLSASLQPSTRLAEQLRAVRFGSVCEPGPVLRADEECEGGQATDSESRGGGRSSHLGGWADGVQGQPGLVGECCRDRPWPA